MLVGIVGITFEEYASVIERMLSTFKYLTEGKVIGCSLVTENLLELAFLRSYCLGAHCSSETDRQSCETVDVVAVSTESGKLLEESQTDGIADCMWDEQTSGFGNKCKVKYQ